MTKQSTITNLIVMPLIASAVFLASPAFANDTTRTTHREVRNLTKKEYAQNTKRGIAGTVTSIDGIIIKVTSLNGTQYTVDTSNATIMKASGEGNVNPSIADITDVKTGDAIVVRGVIKDTEIAAQKIFDSKVPLKMKHHLRNKKMHLLGKNQL